MRIDSIYQTENAYLMATHKDLFRPYSIAKVITIEMIQPEQDLPFRLCVKFEYVDESVDWLPLSDLGRTYVIDSYNKLLNMCDAKL